MSAFGSHKSLPLTQLGRQVESAELVPGDVYEVSDPSLTQFPCDSLLLAGDCIVNESMLTGTWAWFSRLISLETNDITRRVCACLKDTSNG